MVTPSLRALSVIAAAFLVMSASTAFADAGVWAPATATDPKHRGVHEYVGEAYLLTDNLPKAEEHLAALRQICGAGCEEYKDLAREVAEYKKKH